MAVLLEERGMTFCATIAKYAMRCVMLAMIEFSVLWCRLQLDDLTSQHEAYARQLRDRLLREQDLAVEREREAAQARLREAAERCCIARPCNDVEMLCAKHQDTT